MLLAKLSGHALHVYNPIVSVLTFQDGELDLKWVKVQYVEQHCFVHDTNNPYL